MAKTVTVPALQTFEYQGQTYRRGDLVTLAPIEAAIQARLRHVSLQILTADMVTAAPVSDPDPEPEPAPVPRRRRRRYRRRDMVAEDLT